MLATSTKVVKTISSQLGCFRLPSVRRHMRQTPGVEEAFGYVLFATVVIAAIVAVISLRGPRYDHIGRGGLFEDDPQRRPEAPAVTAAVRDEEIRQLVAAKNARRAAKGEAPLDVDAEVARLTPKQSADPALVAEIREMVELKNARRLRQGKEPLDVEAEVARQVRELLG
jgi:hypothetical protein